MENDNLLLVRNHLVVAAAQREGEERASVKLALTERESLQRRVQHLQHAPSILRPETQSKAIWQPELLPSSRAVTPSAIWPCRESISRLSDKSLTMMIVLENVRATAT